MESLRKVLEVIENNPVVMLKYTVFTIGLIVSFTNLFDCIVTNSPLQDYLMYVAVIFVGTILLVLIQSNNYLCFILGFFGLLTVAFSEMNEISWGIILVIFSKRIAGNLLYSSLIIFITMVLSFGVNIFYDSTPSQMVNIVAMYTAVFIMDYLLYLFILNKMEYNLKK